MFDREYFSLVGLAGGKGGNSIWHYYDANNDNVASLAGSSINAGYFKRAYSDHGIIARVGDIIMIYSQSATNAATPILAAVPDTWDSNGASVIVGGLGQVA